MGLNENQLNALPWSLFKVYAARQAIGDSDFFLVARTDARGTSAKRGMEESITRANLYYVRFISQETFLSKSGSLYCLVYNKSHLLKATRSFMSAIYLIY